MKYKTCVKTKCGVVNLLTNSKNMPTQDARQCTGHKELRQGRRPSQRSSNRSDSECIKELHYKLKQIDKENPIPQLPYPKLITRSNFCDCKTIGTNNLREGEPLPIKYIDHEKSHIQYPTPRAYSDPSREYCCCSQR